MRNNSQVGCEEDGRFQLLQCRRAPASNMRRCFCANQTNGEMIDGTMRTVMSRDDLPDCELKGVVCVWLEWPTENMSFIAKQSYWHCCKREVAE